VISDNKDMTERRLARRAVSSEGKWWSDSQKLEAVQTYLMTGNQAMTARILKIPEETVRRWVKTTWWQDIVADLRIQDELKLSTRLKNIVDKTMSVIEDRLEHGDFVYDQKTGEMRRKPVAMRDAHKVGLDLDQRRDLVLQRAVPVASVEQIDDKLNKLAQKFADIVNGRKPASEEPIDVESKMVPDEAIPDEVLSDDGQEGFGEILQEDEGGDPRPPW
jgi:transposase-like protein